MKKPLLILSLPILFGLTNCRARLAPDKAPEFIMVVQKHPDFGNTTLEWYTDATYNDALKTGKLILVEDGRKACSMCRTFVTKVLPELSTELTNFVGLAADIDESDTLINKLWHQVMPNAQILPIVLIIDSKGIYQRGIWGKDTQDVEKVRKFIRGN